MLLCSLVFLQWLFLVSIQNTFCSEGLGMRSLIMWLFPKFLFILCLITLCVVHADITAVNLFVFKLSFFIVQ